MFRLCLLFFEIVVEALRVGSAFSEGRGEGCVWRASKDLIFFSTHSEGELGSVEMPLQILLCVDMPLRMWT